MLAMTLHPEAQKRAQEEIDEVIGDERLPTFADRDQLPYLWNVFREVMRWIVVCELCIYLSSVAVAELRVVPFGTTTCLLQKQYCSSNCVSYTSPRCRG